MRKTVLASDMSGAEIEEGKGAVVTLNYNDGRKGQFVSDLTDKEADALKGQIKGRAVARRGRKPGTRNATPATPEATPATAGV